MDLLDIFIQTYTQAWKILQEVHKGEWHAMRDGKMERTQAGGVEGLDHRRKTE